MTVTSAAEVAARMNKCATALQRAQRGAVRSAALVVQASVAATSPARLRNVGKKGGALRTAVRMRGSDAAPSATVKAVGPWPIIEYDTPGHLIGAGRTKRSRAQLVKSGHGTVLKAGGYEHPVLGPIGHPGTKGKLVFHKGVALGTPKATTIVRKASVTAVATAFH